MGMTDPIADMLTRIRNAHAVNKTHVEIPASKLKVSIADVLQSEGYINGYETIGEKAEKKIVINLKYYQNKPVIDEIKRVSKPSLRVYAGSKNMPKVLNGLGTVIVSTPKGVMSCRQASQMNVGGEVLCTVS